MDNEPQGTAVNAPETAPGKRWGNRRMNGHGAAGGGAYFVAFIGALVYFIQQSNSFGEGLLGFLQACVWPAIVVYKLLGHLA